jgi:hypothetical protein
VASDPTLEMVAAVGGGENLTCDEIICEMCHMYYLPFFILHIYYTTSRPICQPFF